MSAQRKCERIAHDDEHHHRYYYHYRERERWRPRETVVCHPVPEPPIVQLPPPPPPTLPKPRPKPLSNIHPVSLEENVGGGRGNFASVSVLEPVMRVERSGPSSAGNPLSTAVYRIILSCKIQFTINRAAEELQRHNRIFDSVKVRYLYRSGEKHELLPKGDNVPMDLNMTYEDGKSSDLTGGLSITGAGQPVPAFTVHAQHANKVTYERKLRSWRKSLTFETYPPPIAQDAAYPSIFNLGAANQRPCIPETHFRVTSPHARKCTCHHRQRRCRLRHSRHHPYNRSGTWEGQTEAQLHLWTPEIYESMSCPLTITREVDVDEIERILRQAPLHGLSPLRRYLHFDFDVDVRLREIGWGFWGIFKSASQPAEIRARNDSGKPLVPDRVKFCVTCCTDRISWPQYETRDLQCEAEERVRSALVGPVVAPPAT
ncbi:hypothetical protein B0T17DRAFT_512396 [Bombardia bombarda]|uniref:Uncharacterized protein n=1 Tax=Bombardia bombarda TaxID=252184 RepID=A0AA39U3A0_9PEZI|nr:hypothetical protein B0T17DRAFT_512396 [Bombardia bombarda]